MKKKSKTFVIGDMHGGHKALVQVLERAKFDYENDTLISLGDVADGWPDVAECFEELMKIKNIVMVRGNHDNWLLNYLRFEETPDIWITQGGRNSFLSYQKHPGLKEKHKDFLMSTPYYYIDEKKRLYVHGGLAPGEDPSKKSPEELMWDRQLYSMLVNKYVKEVIVPGFEMVFIGHTSVSRISKTPIISGNVVFMDTGGGFENVLSLMNVDTKKVFQSDLVATLYPGNHHGKYR